MPNPAPYLFPGLILIDQREQLPYSFADLVADAAVGGGPLTVRTSVTHLATGDYSIRGFAGLVAVERKSLEDLYRTIGQERDRFERELARLAEMQAAAVVVEAPWDVIIRHPPAYSQLQPKTVFRSILAWQQRYPRVQWALCTDRRFAEVYTFRLLERFWRTKYRQARKREPKLRRRGRKPAEASR